MEASPSRLRVYGKDSRFLPKIISIISLVNPTKKNSHPPLIQAHGLYRNL